MELPILVVLLSSFIISVGSHPKNSDVIPKDYYKRQILQPIPGYIPVYIKADEAPLVRTPSKKHSSNVAPVEKVLGPREKHMQLEDNKDEGKKSGEVQSGSQAAETKNQPSDVPKKTEPAVDVAKNEKKVGNPQVKVDDLKS